MRQTVISVVVLALVAGSAVVGHELIPHDHELDRDLEGEAPPGIVTLLAPRSVSAEIAVPPGDIATCTTEFLEVTPQRAPCAPALGHERVELCTDHEKTVWHPLVKRDRDGAITCTYAHEHHDDPNSPEMVELFGRAGAWYGSTDSISYPWHTSSPAGHENDVKHEGYKWFTARNIPCKPAHAAPDDGCVTSYRVQIHARGDISDATTRFHSYSTELELDYHGTVGLARHGGHIDTRFLGLLTNGGSDMVCPPLMTNPTGFTCGFGQPLRESGSVNVPAGHTAHNNPTPNWYSKHALSPVSINIESFGPVDYTDTAKQLYWPTTPVPRNNSQGRIGVAFAAGGGVLRPLSYPSGTLNLSRYTDRAGTLVSTCTPRPADPNCIPLEIENVQARSYGLKDLDGPGIKDFDVPSPATGKSLIKFPN